MEVNPPRKVLLRTRPAPDEDRERAIEPAGSTARHVHGPPTTGAGAWHYWCIALCQSIATPFIYEIPPGLNLSLGTLPMAERRRTPRPRALSTQPSPNPASGCPPQASPSAQVLRPTSEVEEELFVITDHARRKAKLSEILAPIIPVNGGWTRTILVCTGKPERSRVFPVAIKAPEDEIEAWSRIREGWYSHAGRWRRILRPVLGANVSIVKIRVAGPLAGGEPNSGEFIGLYSRLNREQLQDEIAEYKAQAERSSCANYSGSGYYSGSGTIGCSENCPAEANSWIEDHEVGPCAVKCPLAAWRSAKRALVRLEIQPFLSAAFSHPDKVAPGNALLADNELLKSHLGILSEIESWHRPNLAECQFRGLLIEQEWTDEAKQLVFPCIASALLVVVVASRFLYGDWGVAWTVGGAFLALLSVLFMWVQYVARSML